MRQHQNRRTNMQKPISNQDLQDGHIFELMQHKCTSKWLTNTTQSPLGRFTLTQTRLETQIKHNIELNLPYDTTHSADVGSSVEKERQIYITEAKDSLGQLKEKCNVELPTPTIPSQQEQRPLLQQAL